jgi:hypothetical protein
MRDDLNNILELAILRYEFPDERTRAHILDVINLYMNVRVINGEISDYHVRDITGTSYPIDYTRLEFEIVFCQRSSHILRFDEIEIVTIGMTSENNGLREPIAFGTIKKHTMI